MKKAIALTMFLIIVLTFLSACSSSDGLTGRTISIFGIVGNKASMTKTDDKEYPAAKGLKLGTDYSVSTGETTYVYLDVDDKSLAKMNEESKVYVAQISEAKLRLDLVQGSILVNEREKSKGELEIRAGNTVLRIRGTFVTVNNNNTDITVFIIEGAIDVIVLSGEVTPVGSGKRVTVVNDVATAVDLEWNMLDVFTRECILEYQDDLSDTLSEDDFNVIRGNNAEDGITIDKGNLITIKATVIWNPEIYNEQFSIYRTQYKSIGIRTYGVIFDSPIKLPNGELVAEAEVENHNNGMIWREIGLPYFDETGHEVGGVAQKTATFTGYINLDESYTGAIEDYRGDDTYTVDYLFRPNGPYIFEIVSIEETIP